MKENNDLTHYPASIESVLQSRVLIMGMGKSGLSAYGLLKKIGASVVVYDKNTALIETLKSEHKDLKGISCLQEVDIKDIGTVVLSPGIDWTHYSDHFKDQSINLISEVGLGALVKKTSRVISVTGTNGKSTVTALVTHLLKSSGLEAMSCGNFGHPYSQWVTEQDAPSHIGVVELSSYQLEHLKNLRASVAILLPIESDHLNRHKHRKTYLDIKLNIVRHNNALGLLIADSSLKNILQQERITIPVAWVDDQGVQGALNLRKVSHGITGDVNCNVDWNMCLGGKHNHKNILSSVAAFYGMTNGSLTEGTIENFKGLPFRQEFLIKDESRWIVNDSKSTSPDSVVSAIHRFETPFHLIMGGRNKGLSFEQVRQALEGKHIKVWVYGEARDFLEKEIQGSLGAPDLKTVLENVLKQQKEEGWQNILFSPGCESFDQFENYRDRGMKFNQFIQSMGF